MRFLIRLPLAVLLASATLFGVSDAQGQTAETGDGLLLQRPVPTPGAVISSLPGVFTYSFRAAGWPDGPSPHGVDPGAVRLLVDGHAWDDLVTGRPRYDLAPVVLMTGGRLADPYRASFRTDALAVQAPLTRIRYTSTGDGLQEARVFHVQDRSMPGWTPPDSGDAPPRLNVLFGYEGAGAANEYPGSRLRRERKVLGRVAVRSRHWDVSLLNVAGRRRIGAHGGVEPIAGRGYESIYQRLGAGVTDEEHSRRTIRNDLILSVAARGAAGGGAAAQGAAGDGPSSRDAAGERTARSLTADLFWSAQTQSFDDGTTPRRWEVHRFGTRLDASTTVGSAPLLIGVDASVAVETPGGLTDSLVTDGVGSAGRVLAGAGANVSARFRGATTRFRAGAGLDDGRSYPELTFSVENARFDASATWSGRSNAWIDHTGFFEYAPAFPDPPDVRSLSASVSARGAAGLLSVEPRITFVREVDAPVRMLGGDAVTSTAGTLSGAAARSTVSLRITLNDAPSRGPYAVVAPTLHSADLEVRTELDRAWKNAMPDAWVEGRAGYRRLMFKGDLDLDAYARGRVWTDMRGRRLHTPTGLLMLAPDGSGTVVSSGMLDIVAEAGIRGATIILAWENVLSGTSVHIGNLIVPDYPLPAQRLRFGVFWPISN